MRALTHRFAVPPLPAGEGWSFQIFQAPAASATSRSETRGKGGALTHGLCCGKLPRCFAGLILKRSSDPAHLNFDEDILKARQEETRARTKIQAVDEALSDFVRRRKIEKLIQLPGKVTFSSDWKRLRKGWDRGRHDPR